MRVNTQRFYQRRYLWRSTEEDGRAIIGQCQPEPPGKDREKGGWMDDSEAAMQSKEILTRLSGSSIAEADHQRNPGSPKTESILDFCHIRSLARSTPWKAQPQLKYNGIECTAFWHLFINENTCSWRFMRHILMATTLHLGMYECMRILVSPKPYKIWYQISFSL